MSSRPSRGMVVSAHPMASRAGAAVLKKGGNSVDAAVATSLVLGVVEPAFSGIGGGGFALLHLESGKSLALDYRETAPLAASATMFDDGSDTNRVGPLAIATPGLLAGHIKLLEEYGTMRFRDLVAPAINAAKSGASSETLSSKILRDTKSASYEKIRRFQTSSEVFISKGKLPQLARTLGTLREKGPSEFYRGSVPEMVARYLMSIGGILSEEDFGRYKPRMRKPVIGEYKGLDLISMPPPSAGGALLIHGLQVVEELGEAHSYIESRLPLSTAAVLRLILGEKWRFGDPDFSDIQLAPFLSKAAAKRAADGIRRGTRPNVGQEVGLGSTSHISVVDRKGNAVAATETIECYYGSGVTIPGLGIVMNDEMHDFDVVPGRPNSVAPLKRPASSMTPTIVLRDGSPMLVLGGAGSERIISSVFQTIRNVVEGGMSLNRAVAEPRIHFAGETLEVEGGIPEIVLSELRGAGFNLHPRPRRDPYFGGVHAIMKDPGSGRVIGAADPRRMGAAASA